MNKAITDGLILSPPAWDAGLDRFSRGDGRPGSDSYAGSGMAALVPADQDFGGCVEMIKVAGTQQIRAFQPMPVIPGCYVRVTARVKAVAGNLLSIRVAATPIGTDGTPVAGLTTTAPAVALPGYGKIVTVTGIIGTGARGGVDLAWNDTVAHAHVGLDLVGPAGGLVRIDDIQVEDVTGAYLRTMMDWVDVRDFGAKGDGIADDTAAFVAANAAAAGREVLVSKGVYRLTEHVTFSAEVRFEGTVTMPVSKRLSLVKNFDLVTYIDAFGDEEEGFRKAIQALFNFTDHDTLDMCGRRVELTRPLDVQAAVHDKTTYANQRKIRNGQIQIAAGSAAFDTETRTVTCGFDAANPTRLTDVPDIAAIPVGSLVTAGVGVGREVYVSGRDLANRTLHLSQALWGAPETQSYTFKRFKYALDFSGFANLQRFTLQDIEFLLADNASGVLLPYNGLIFHVKDCYFTGPKDRGITSHAAGCQGMLIDRCQFLSNEGIATVEERHTIGFNVNKNDAKVRNNRAVKFRHFAVLSGSGHIVTGNHFFQGDNESLGQRTAGIVFAEAQAKSVLMSNYIDNCYIEWTNEHDGAPDFQTELSFGGLQIIGNIIFSSNVPSSFRPIHVKPFGAGHFINGMTVTGNNFKTIKGQALERVDMVDTTHAELNYARFADVNVHSNTFHAVSKQFQNPITVPVQLNSPQSVWTEDLSDYMPFGGEVRVVTAMMAEGRLRDGAGQTVSAMPYADVRIGTGRQSLRLTWPQPTQGKVYVTARCDAPT